MRSREPLIAQRSEHLDTPILRRPIPMGPELSLMDETGPAGHSCGSQISD